MKIAARAEYALRAVLLLARSPSDRLKGEVIAATTAVPLSFLTEILGELKRAGIVGSKSGPDGGYWLKESPGELTVSGVIEAVDGSPLLVGGRDFRQLTEGDDAGLAELWQLLGSILEGVSIADLRADTIRVRLIENLGSRGSVAVAAVGSAGRVEKQG